MKNIQRQDEPIHIPKYMNNDKHQKSMKKVVYKKYEKHNIIINTKKC